MDDPVNVLKVLADPVRWKALAFLREPSPSTCSMGDMGVCACDLEQVLGVSQPTVSHHMKLLVGAGLVRSQRRGRWVFYELDADAFAALEAELGRFARAPRTRARAADEAS